jgi:hypothetical protein
VWWRRIFVTGFETDGVVQRSAPILKDLVGMTDAEASEYIWSQGWKASIVADEPKIIQHEESFEVQRDGKRTALRSIALIDALDIASQRSTRTN